LTPTPNVIEQAATLLREQISNLENEVSKLQRALSQLTEGRRGPGRPRGARSAASTSTARRTGGGRRRSTRADQAVKLIKANPGITASEVAKKLRIKPNYLYRVLGDLQKEGKVKKSGRKYTAA